MEKRQCRIAVSSLALSPRDALCSELIKRTASVPDCVKTGADYKDISHCRTLAL